MNSFSPSIWEVVAVYMCIPVTMPMPFDFRLVAPVKTNWYLCHTDFVNVTNA